MQVKNGKIMFCHCCSNGNIDGGCIYGREKTCGIIQARLGDKFKPIVKKLKECGELPHNFRGFKIGDE